jgi:hypothetical protein
LLFIAVALQRYVLTKKREFYFDSLLIDLPTIVANGLPQFDAGLCPGRNLMVGAEAARGCRQVDE